MGRSKKKVKTANTDKLKSREVAISQDPDKYYSQQPTWNFNTIDEECWNFGSDEARDTFWDKILPRFQQFEKCTWNEILLKNKTQNHSIKYQDLNPCAQQRLSELRFPTDSIISLRIQGGIRVYGYIPDGRGVYNILWIDLKHGDNQDCVCRSNLKHT